MFYLLFFRLVDINGLIQKFLITVIDGWWPFVLAFEGPVSKSARKESVS